MPLGIRLDCGYQSVVVFATHPGMLIWEKTVQPPSPDGGDPIKTSTMLNVDFETTIPQRLMGFDAGVVVAAYDPKVYNTLVGELINVIDSVTFAYPEGSAEVYWAYLQKAVKTPLQKDQQPEMTLTIPVTNWDPVNCVESAPVFISGTGSCGPHNIFGALSTRSDIGEVDYDKPAPPPSPRRAQRGTAATPA
jgi:hypothetical protein